METFTSYMGKFGGNKFLSVISDSEPGSNSPIPSSQFANLCFFLFISMKILFCFCVVLNVLSSVAGLLGDRQIKAGIKKKQNMFVNFKI